jgi:hypothetical protein
MDAVLGIDIAKAKFTVPLLTPDGKQRRKTCPNTPAGFDELANWLTRRHVTHVHACLSKIGPGRVRKALYFPAIAALRFTPTIRAVRQRLVAAGKPNMVIIGAAMRRLIHLAYGVLKSGNQYPATCSHP